jgi:hypothetical protein
MPRMPRERDNPTVVVVARQAGSANALRPVVEALSARGRAVKVLALGPAYEALKDGEVYATRVESFRDAESVLDAVPDPGFMLTGTSLAVADDALFWCWARRRSVPTLAFVDHWVNYWQRFTTDACGGAKYDAVPDKIAVIDRVARDAMIASGCPEHLLLVTGNPAFDCLRSLRGVPRDETRARLAPSSALVLFVSEPHSVNYPTGSPRALGFTEGEVLSLTLAALEEIGSARGEKFTVAIKLHPTEAPEAVGEVLGRVLSYTHVSAAVIDEQRYEVVAASDVVVGMTSLLLYEAALMGRSVVSIQPNRLQRNDMTDFCPGIEVVTGTAGVRSALEVALDAKMMGDIAGAQQVEPPGDATDNFLNYIFSQMRERQPD